MTTNSFVYKYVWYEFIVFTIVVFLVNVQCSGEVTLSINKKFQNLNRDVITTREPNNIGGVLSKLPAKEAQYLRNRNAGASSESSGEIQSGGLPALLSREVDRISTPVVQEHTADVVQVSETDGPSVFTVTPVYLHSTISETTHEPLPPPPPLLETTTACTKWLQGNLDSLTQDQFFAVMTNECRYDRLIKPLTNGPLNMTMQIEIGHIEAIEHLQFKMHMLVQYRYIDQRLHYRHVSPTREPLIGEDKLREKIWIPHIILRNERDTSIMGIEGKDVFISISPEGEVIYSYRMTAMIYCWMDLQKFPFDDQVCDVIFKSWTYNSSQLILHWDKEMPFMIASQLHLTEFSLTGNWTSSGFEISPRSRRAFVGNYSALTFKFQLSREAGFYFMDYFIPSIMLVMTSWVSFWLQADNAAPRVTLGTSTMLSFITLASGQSKTLPKVSYIKASEIWFLGCTAFIFLSMAEFAFVNIIWRRSKQVELKKVNSKYILKSTLTPRMARKDLQRSSSMSNLHKSRSCSSLDISNTGKDCPMANANHHAPNNYNNYLTVHSFPSTMNIPTITMQSEDDLLNVPGGANANNNNRRGSVTSISVHNTSQCNGSNDNSADALDSRWTTMTPQEVAMWIDKRSRIVFPLTFLVFNIFYWSFVFAL